MRLEPTVEDKKESEDHLPDSQAGVSRVFRERV